MKNAVLFSTFLIFLCFSAQAQIIRVTDYLTGSERAITLNEIYQAIETPSGRVTLLLGAKSSTMQTTDSIESFMAKVGSTFVSFTAVLPAGETQIALPKSRIASVLSIDGGNTVLIKTTSPTFTYTVDEGFDNFMDRQYGNTPFNEAYTLITDTANVALSVGHTFFQFSATQYSLTLTLPSDPITGDKCLITFGDYGVRSLSITGDYIDNTGRSPYIDSGTSISFKFLENTWYRTDGEVSDFNRQYAIVTDTANASVFRRHTVFDFPGTQATFTISLPASPLPGDICQVTFNDIVTSLTVSGSGRTVMGTALTSAAVGTDASWKYIGGSVNKWSRQE